MRRDDLTLQALGGQCQAHELSDQEKYEEARELLLTIRRKHPRGVNSGSLSHALAVACCRLLELEKAYSYIEEALASDPLCVTYNRGFDSIVECIRDALAEVDRAPDDPSTPRLYALLTRTGEADGKSHLVMARHLAHVGQLATARRLLDALVTLEPMNRAAWLMLSEVAQASGDSTLADEAARQASALDEPLPLAAISGEARS